MPTNSNNSPYIAELRATVIGYGVSADTVDALIRAARIDGRQSLGAELHRIMDEHEASASTFHGKTDVPSFAEDRKIGWMDRALSYVGPYGPF